MTKFTKETTRGSEHHSSSSHRATPKKEGTTKSNERGSKHSGVGKKTSR